MLNFNIETNIRFSWRWQYGSGNETYSVAWNKEDFICYVYVKIN